jgi:hypothetical protein
MRLQMCRLAVLLLVSLTAPGCGQKTTPAVEQPSEDPELKWAKARAEHFMNAAVAKNGKQADGLLSKSFQERAKGDAFASVKQTYSRWELESSELAPSGVQAVFKGAVFRPQYPFSDTRASFSLMLIKEAGEWKVDSYTCSE